MAQALGVLRPYNCAHSLIRIGPEADGGYLLPDCLQGIAASFSPGVSFEFGFDLDLLARGIPVHMADASVDLPKNLHDGASFEAFLEAVDFHPRANILYDPSHFVLQQLDYLGFIDRYHERIKAFHVKDAEFRPDARTGVYGGYRDWAERAGRFRSLGDGQVDFRQIFSKLTHYGFDGWAVLEWECCFKHPEQGAAEGAPFIADHIIRPTPYAFDDFAGGTIDEGQINRALGIES